MNRPRSVAGVRYAHTSAVSFRPEINVLVGAGSILGFATIRRFIRLRARCPTYAQRNDGCTCIVLGLVLDWHSAEPPTPESIALAPCVTQGHVHLKAITETGGSICRYGLLDADGIQPWLFRGAHGWQNSNVQLGFIPVRPQQPEDRDLPVFSTWGFDIAASIADARFVQRTGPWAKASRG